MIIIDDIKAVGDIRELFVRVVTMISMKTGMHKIKFPSRYLTDEEILKEFGYEDTHELVKNLRNKSSTFFFDLKECRNKFPSIFSESYISSIIEKADRICAHEFRVFEKDVKFDDEVNWHWSETEKSWPLIHWSDLNIDFEVNGKRGDLKYTWELNKHQHFPALGRAFLVAGEDRYLKEFSSEIKSWVRQNPPEVGINWANNQEISYRSISWILALNFFAEDLDDELIISILKVLIKNAQHIYHDIDFTIKCIKNSHIIGDAAGLAILSIFLKELPEAKKWYKKAYSAIEDVLQWIFHKDGSYKLLSLNYQRVSIYFLLIYALVAKRHDFDVPDNLWGILKKSIESLAKIVKDDGRLPVIGAWDSAKPVRLSENTNNDLKPLFSSAAVIFKEPVFKFLSGSFSEETYWLLGAKSFEEYNNLSDSNDKQLISTGKLDNGIYILRGKGIYISLVGGEHLINFQRHSDYLSMELSFKGKDFIVDGGNYKYNTRKEWNHYFRSTFAHNTVIVDDQSQAIPYKEFRWLYRGKTKLNKFFDNEKYALFDGEHNGFDRLGVTHRRVVFLLKNESCVVIIDRLTGNGRHKFQQLFHFEPVDIKLNDDNGICVVRNDDVSIKIIPSNVDNSLSSSIVIGQDNPVQGWISHEYGEKIASPTLIYEKVSICPAYFITSILPFSFEYAYDSKILALTNDFVGVKIKKNSCVCIVVYFFNNKGTFNYKGHDIKDSSFIKEENGEIVNVEHMGGRKGVKG